MAQRVTAARISVKLWILQKKNVFQHFKYSYLPAAPRFPKNSQNFWFLNNNHVAFHHHLVFTTVPSFEHFLFIIVHHFMLTLWWKYHIAPRCIHPKIIHICRIESHMAETLGRELWGSFAVTSESPCFLWHLQAYFSDCDLTQSSFQTSAFAEPFHPLEIMNIQ